VRVRDRMTARKVVRFMRGGRKDSK
jgi:hypothetical protein